MLWGSLMVCGIFFIVPPPPPPPRHTPLTNIEANKRCSILPIWCLLKYYPACGFTELADFGFTELADFGFIFSPISLFYPQILTSVQNRTMTASRCVTTPQAALTVPAMVGVPSTRMEGAVLQVRTAHEVSIVLQIA